MPVVTSCLLGPDLSDPPPGMEVVDLPGSPPQSVLPGQGRAVCGWQGANSLILMNHRFSWRLLGSRTPSVYVI